jgi:GDP-L-fucose synthase
LLSRPITAPGRQEPAAARQYDLDGKRIWVAGHTGMVGSAIVRRLGAEDCEIITIDRTRVDLRRQVDTERWMEQVRPDVVVVAAAKVGGIHANSAYPADFLYDNMTIEGNIIRAAFNTEVEKLLFLGSSCIYPRDAEQPIRESALLTGPLEPTNEWYAIAKIAGIKLCQAYSRQYGRNFISVMPANIYGPGDNFHHENSHVLAALLRRFHDAKEERRPSVTVWGTGKPRREFIYVDDVADACIFALRRYSGETPVNVGTGVDISIGDLASTIREIVGYDGKIAFDPTRPDGMPRKVMDVSRLREMGWVAPTALKDGLERFYRWFRSCAADPSQLRV